MMIVVNLSPGNRARVRPPLPRRLCRNSVHGSTVREASRQASSTAFSSEPVEESPRTELLNREINQLPARPEPVEGLRVHGDTVSLGDDRNDGAIGLNAALTLALSQGARVSERGGAARLTLISLLAFVLLLLSLSACEREQRRFSEPAPMSDLVNAVASSELRPGPSASAEKQLTTNLSYARKGIYEENGWAVSEGKRLYSWFNCVGCHAHGGGGMGPALMDDQWLYGSAPEQIFATIVQGRPNGMPAFGGKIPEQQLWQLVAYVRSLSGQLSKDVSTTRSDHMSIMPSEQRLEEQNPKPVAPSARPQ
jgi:cytochrome c oxidase cbb3-type subunit 3